MTDPFVQFLNLDEDASFRHVRCLDVWERNTPQPEALYEDPETGAQLVIERKAVVWPLEYAKRHRAYHDLMGSLTEELGEFCQDRPLTLELPVLRSVDKRELRELAGVVAEGIRENEDMLEGAGFSFTVGRDEFRVLPWIELDGYGTLATSGVAFHFDINARDPEKPAPENLPPGMRRILDRMFVACEKKFQEFGAARRVLLLDPCGAFWLSDTDWWKAVLSYQQPTACIDEIWLVFQDEDATGEAYWSIDLVYSKELGQEVERSGAIGVDEPRFTSGARPAPENERAV